MAVVIGSASIKITAMSEDLRRDIGNSLNEAIGDINTTKLDDLNRKLRQSELELVKARQAVTKFEAESRQAEEELAKVRQDSKSTTEQITQAELNLARAHAEANVARDKVRSITLDMTRQQEGYRRSLIETRTATADTERDTHRLHNTLVSLHGITRGIGAAFSFMLPSMGQVNVAGRVFTTTLELMTKATVVALAAQAAFAGAGGLVAVAGALSEAAGAALLLPAGLAAATIGIGTLVVGLQGMGDALKVVGDTQKFNEAIKDLSPNARSFAVAVKDLLPAFKELRLQVQDRLFAGLAKEFADLGRIHLPIVQSGLKLMATALNSGAKEFADFARSKQTVSDLGTLFSNSALGAQGLSAAVGPVLAALRDIGTVASEFLPGLAGGFAGAASRFGEFIAHARETGALREFLENGIAALRDIFGILGNIGSIIGSVLNAGQAAGAGFLSTAREITGQLAEWAKSSAGQSAFTEFLLSAKQAAQALMPIIGSVVGLVAHELVPILANIAQIVGPSVKIVLDAIGQALEVARPGINALAVGFSDFISALAPALPAIGNLARVLGESLGAVLTAIGPVIAEVATVFADQLAAALPQLVPAVIAIATAFGKVLIAVAPLIPSLVSLLGPFVQTGGIIDHLVPIIETLVSGFADLVEILTPVIDIIADSLIKILDGVADIMPELVDAFLKLVEALAPVVEDLLPPLVDLFVALLPILKPIIELIGAFASALGPVVGLITATLGPAIELVTGAVDLVSTAAGGLVDLGGMVLEGLGVIDSAQGSFTASSRNMADEVSAQYGRVGGALTANEDQIGGWLDTVTGATEDAVGSMLGFATGTDQALADAVTKVGDGMRKIREAMAAGTGPAGAAGLGVGNSFQQAMSGGLLQALQRAQDTSAAIGRALNRDFSAAGSAVMTSFASGMDARVQTVIASAIRAMARLNQILPHSPAEKGPLSGRGWSLYGGIAVIEAFAEGITRAIPQLLGPATLAAQTVADGLVPAGIPAGDLPAARLARAAAGVRGGDGASSPADLHAAIVDAIEGWQVTVSAREAASGVNKVNQDNRSR
jgi:phage-related protein